MASNLPSQDPVLTNRLPMLPVKMSILAERTRVGVGWGAVMDEVHFLFLCSFLVGI